jgi:predicted transcriptional regulator with HTH domain
MNIHFYNWILLTSIVISILIIIFILFPNYPYLGAFIVLLGALLVFLVGESLNKSHKEKNREMFLLNIKPIININIDLAEFNRFIISDKSTGNELKLLENMWESGDSTLTKIGLENEMSKNLLVLKENVKEINENASDINALNVELINLKDSTKFTDIIGRIVSFEDDLEGKLGEFIDNSQKMSIGIEELISSEEKAV